MIAAWMLRTLLVGLLFGLAARVAEPAAGWLRWPRRWVWVAALVGSLALPLIALLLPGTLPGLPAWLVPPIQTATVVAAGEAELMLLSGAAAETMSLQGAAPAADWVSAALLAGWAVLSAAMLAGVAWTHLRLRRLRAACVRVDVEGGPVWIGEGIGPAVLGLRRPAVVVPHTLRSAPAEEQRLILLHEREHIAAGDPWLLALALVALAAMPWNVPLWWQNRRLRLAVEVDCDARVLTRGISRRSYARVLLHTAGGPALLSLLSPAWGGRSFHLERRMIAMTANRPPHALLRALPVLAMAVGIVVAACDTADPAARSAGLTAPVADQVEIGTDPGGIPYKVYEQADGLTRVEVGHDPRKPNTAIGFSYGWDFDPPLFKPLRSPKAGRMPSFPVVKEVRAGSMAELVGIHAGDTIVSVNGRDARETPLFRDRELGKFYIVRVRRNGREQDHAVRVGTGLKEGKHQLVDGGKIDIRADTVVSVDTIIYTAPADRQPTGQVGIGYTIWFYKPGESHDHRPARPGTVYPEVTQVLQGSSAHRAGVVVGDTIVASNGRDARSNKLFPDARPGSKYTLRLRRDGKEREVVVEAEARP